MKSFLDYNSYDIPVVVKLDVRSFKSNSKEYFWMRLASDGLGNPIHIPIIVAKGKKDGPVLGITAALHGNEINGIQVIQRLMDEIDTVELSGTIVGIPVVNVPSFLRRERFFVDGVDLNRIMPGKANGNMSEIYAHRFFERVVKEFDYLLDLHTASFGRINSYYLRADMETPEVKELAMLQNADVIVHNPPSDGTLRGAADELGIPSITIEVGNPDIFQKKLIRSGLEGIHNVLCHLGMIDDEIVANEKKTVICSSSYWIYSELGGLLTVYPSLREKLEANAHIATVRDVFGNIIKDFYLPESGVVVGKSTHPVNQSGGRILHLGIIQ
jgi:predicted deacylase